MATLADIKAKVRRIVKAPSEAQLSEAQLLDYINNFLLYDMPENVRLFTFRKTLTFYTTPYVDTYETILRDTTYPAIRTDAPLYNFKNTHITEHDPAYVDGTRLYLSLSRNEFFAMYPPVQQRTQIGTGDGVTTLFTGTLASAPVIQNSVMFTSYDANNEGLVLTDKPQLGATTGAPLVLGDLIWPNDTTAVGTINYKTGDYSFTFPAAPDSGAMIYAHAIPSTLGKPQAMLYFDNKFILRPVPDAVYSVNIECYVRPTALENDTDIPELEQHWSYIAWGTAKRIFEDRVDPESLQRIMPMFKEQENLVQRRTLVQNQDKEVATIYNMKVIRPWGSWWSW